MAEGQQGAFPVPPGETYNPDFSHPWLYTESRAVVIAGVILCTITLMLRVYTKAVLLHKFGWDDDGYAHGGIGIHIWNITPHMFLQFQKGIFAAGIIYVPALGLAKASLIILYHRIVGMQKVYRWALYVIAGVVIGYSVAITFALIFACRPIQKAWNAALEGSCIDQNGLYAATAVTNTVTDVALLIVPLPVVISLNMPTIQKIGLLFMFIIGGATVVTSVIRLVTLFPFLKTDDKTYQIGWTDLWMYGPPSTRTRSTLMVLDSNVEANFIVICACLPFLRHFLRRYAPKLIGEGSSAGRAYFPNYQNGSSTTRSWRRKPGLTMLQDEVELAENGGSVGSEVRIVKEVKWNITEERSG
ncbi:conserved hypothetical protein [Aspergillus terreus NIH2624]|uniref:Rhodopsin domain-containing protein n=1 Tax=Aspergillus terreus (strain NIH 2624 / FGSC A1156) TaxID=341663 RepID=Q0CFB2_ASPTN|nr:uncharacterized protein ATEG_07622 [Aspergillus terreus NIH2624]EAU31884.1 conserved hypothetical protein [Aspergillus terreus NIH2624]